MRLIVGAPGVPTPGQCIWSTETHRERDTEAHGDTRLYTKTHTHTHTHTERERDRQGESDKGEAIHNDQSSYAISSHRSTHPCAHNIASVAAVAVWRMRRGL